MKIEKKLMLYSMFNNLLISIIKIVGGFIFNLNSLFADGMQTLSDFITDIVSIISIKISKKRPTKYHPFGFGRVAYLSNLFIGLILLALSIFIAVNAFHSHSEIPSLKVLILLSIAFILKLIAIILMYKTGKKSNSILLLTSLEESKVDLYATVGVFIIIILLQFSEYFPILKYSDLVGTLIIAGIILRMSLKIFRENALSLIGETEKIPELENKVKELLNEFNGIKDIKQEYIKYGSYYRINLTLVLDDNLKLKDIVKLQKDIKNTIVKHRSIKIKFVNINVTNEI